MRKKHSANTILLKHNTIYVLPSTMGVGFIAVSLLNFLLGINYQNNLLLGVSYLMAMLLIVALLYGYLNLSGTQVKLASISSAHCQTPPFVTFEVFNKNQLFDFHIEHQYLLSHIHVAHIEQRQMIATPLSYTRGKHQLGAFKFVSHFPFGLVTVWSYLYSDKYIFSYPNPTSDSQQHQLFTSTTQSDLNSTTAQSNDEFKQLIPYQLGMSMHRVSWRHYAKTEQLLVKDYEGDDSAHCLGFDFDQLQGTIEERLSKLCYLVLQAEENEQAYALKLGTQQFNTALGQLHKIKCLEALSEY
ncbi:DUF58 domain-containing protein [Pseudoalteromonas holothuriae]|nr:DUF58 domain-containing protein [Pseudoalteromonas sp. CIP111951]